MTIISMPIYGITIGLELVLSQLVQKKLYHTKDTLNNFLMTVLNLGVDTLMRGVFLFMMAWVFQFRLVDWPVGWSSVLYWVLALVLTDLAYWVVHYLGHMVRIFWAVHVVHHSSTNYNISVGFRSSVFEPLYRGLFFLPLALLGFHAADIMLAFAIQQLYGSLIHTELIRKMGFWEKFMVTPSHHRVHHASNPRYLDKNMGMIFIWWDKLFGTFEPEDEDYGKINYGLTSNLETYNPFSVLTYEWKNILRDVRSAPDLYSKFMYVFGPPGWSHDGSRLTSVQMREQEEQNT